MKKLFLSLAALVTAAMSFNATAADPIYMMGSGDGLSWETFPGKVVNPSADGSYSVTIANLTAFKMSTAQATNWDSFNESAFGYSGAFGDAVYNTTGQTVSLEAWGENQTMPATGSYTITINAARTSMTVKANFSKPTTATPVYLRGGMNGWGTGSAYQFTYDSASASYSWTGTINAGVEFKIADGSWGSINYGGTVSSFNTPVTLTYNGSNIKLNQTFTGTIIFKITGNQQATATFQTEGSDAPKYPEKLYIIGTINGGAWDPSNVAPMTNKGDGIYTITDLKLAENGGSAGFAITGGGSTWDEVNALRYGPSEQDTPAVIGENKDIATGDLSWSIAPGTYNMTFDLAKMVLTIEKVSGDDPVEPTFPDTLYIIGNINGQAFDLTSLAEMNNEGDGIYTFENITFEAPDGMPYFAITEGGADWDAINAHRWGPAVGDTPIVEGENKVDGTGDLSWQINPGVYNLTFDMSELILDVEIVDLFVEPDPKPVTIYLRGECNGWEVSNKYAFADNEDGTYSLSLDALSGEFKVASEDWSSVNLGGDAANEDVASVPAVIGDNTLYQGSSVNLSANNWKNVVLTLNYTAGANTATLNIKADVSDTPVEPTFPDTLYIIGNIDGQAFDLTSLAEMNNEGDGIYTFENITFEAPAGMPYFAITEGGSTWEEINAHRWGPAVGDTPIVEGENKVDGTGDLSWQINPGIYNLTFDMSELILDVEIVDLFVEPTPGDVTIYLRGECNGWEVLDEYAFTDNEDGTYSLSLDALSGEFKVASEDWSSVNLGGEASSDDVKVVAANLGNNTLWNQSDVNLLAGADWSNVEMLLTLTENGAILNIKADVPVVEPGTTTVYVLGEADELGWDLPGKAFTGEDGVVTFTLTNAVKFKVADVNTTIWEEFNPAAYFTTEAYTAAGVYSENGETLAIAHNDNAGSMDQMLPYKGDYEITINLNAMTMTAKALTEAEPVDYSNLDIYIRGGMNEWGTTDDWKFAYASGDGSYVYTFVCAEATAISADTEFKFADADWGLVNYGYNNYTVTPDTTIALDYNGENMYMAEAFEGTITLTIDKDGNATAYFDTTTAGISALGADNADAVYYDLQGRRINNPEKGIYIRVLNGKTTKVVK